MQRDIITIRWDGFGETSSSGPPSLLRSPATRHAVLYARDGKDLRALKRASTRSHHFGGAGAIFFANMRAEGTKSELTQSGLACA